MQGGVGDSASAIPTLNPRAIGLSFPLLVIAVLLVAVLAPSPAHATQDPIAAYSFDEGTGSRVTDFFGDNDGTITGADWVGGKFGTALDFNNSARDLVTVPDANALDLTNAFTLEAWVRPESIGLWRPVISKETTSNISYQLYASGGSENPEGYVADRDSSYIGVIAREELAGRHWSHIALTSDGRDLKLYVDGDLLATDSAVTAQVGRGALQIGGAPVFGEYFNGLIDEVRLYDRVLGESEIEDDLGTAIETPPSRDPIAAYSFDEGTGTRVTDSAGNHDGTIDGAEWVGGKFGTALDFEQTAEDIVQIPHSADLDLSDAFTLEAWVRPETTDYWASVIGKETSNFYSYSLFAGAGDKGIATGILADGEWSYAEVNSASELSERAWSHVALTSDGEDLNLYVDGVLVDTAPAKSAQPSDSPLQIGGNQIDEYFDGFIDEIRIYNRGLSRAEIEADRDTAIETPPSLLAAYSFDEGTGTRVNDSAGDHDGTIDGAEWVGGKFGAALDFEASESDMVSIPHALDLDLSDAFTLEAWVRPEGNQTWNTVIAKEKASDFYSYGLFAGAGTRAPTGIVADGAWSTAEIAAAEEIPERLWSHLAFTSNGETLSLYVDGTLIDTVPAKSAQTSNSPLHIGGNGIWGEYFDGLIDEVRIYNRALDVAEIETDRDTAIETPPSRGPIASYSFSEGTGTAVNDSAGNHDGTITGATWVTGKSGTGLDFEASESDIVEIPHSDDLDLSDAFTLKAWVRPETNGTWRSVIGKETATFYSYSLFAGASDDVPTGLIADGDWSSVEASSTEELPVDTWSQLALTSDGEDLKLYVNGELVDTTAAKSAQSSSSPLQIGGNQIDEYFDGVIDEVRIYNRALAETEIDPPQTTITSPQPSYMSYETWPVEFTSGEEGSTFRCSLDDPNDVPRTTCSSPYSLPRNLDPGWHTFVVAATDSDGITDPTPAKWTFNPEIYPEAPETSKLTSPEEGERTSRYFTLQAEWGGSTHSDEVTGVSFQVKVGYWNQFRTIPTQYVLDASGEEVSWPLPVSNGRERSQPVYFDARAFPNFYNEEYMEDDIKFRAVFDGGVNAAGVSKAVTNEFSIRWGSTRDAIESIGPANLDLMTGQYTITRTDVSIPVPGSDSALEFTRVYHSSYLNGSFLSGLVTGNSRVLGGVWQPSAPVEAAYSGSAWQKAVVRHEDAIPAYRDPETGEVLEEEIPAADWVEIVDNSGGGIAFDLIDRSYVSPEYAREYRLIRDGSNFALTDPDGTRTVFTQNSFNSSEYNASTVSWQATPRSARLVYEDAQGAYRRLKMMIAPAAAGVTCSESPGLLNYALTTPGCRTLTFQYRESEEHYIYDRLTSITYHNATGSGEQVVAQYSYNADDQLIEAWDPRISPALKETYTYNSPYESGKLATLTPPGGESMTFSYGGCRQTVCLKSISQASLLDEGPSEAQTTIAYNVPVRGSGAPYDLSPGTIAEWGQSDYPVDATAIFPPDEIPDDPPSDYSRATVYYMDPDGYLVNTASPAPPGVDGDVISTSETDEHGNVVRSLSPRARLLALADSDPVARSQELDARSVYSDDGTKLVEEWGPLHEVRLESGSTVEARMHRTIQYDEGATTPPEGTPMPLLPTTETVGAWVPGERSDFDQRVTKTDYNWTLRKPTETIVDPNGLNLRTRIIYDENTGLPIERRLPANPDGGDARSTKILYYTASLHSSDASCGVKPAWANLPCKTMPAAQPTGSNPELVVTRYESYSALDQPTRFVESPGGASSPTRTTTITYDAAGRQLRSEQSGGGTALPPTETVYSSTTGLPEVQRFVCEAPTDCRGFDSQEVTTTYDALGRAVSYEDADGNVSQTEYDLLGRPVVATDGKGTQEMTYDEDSGALVQMTDSAAGTFSAAYDADGNIVAQALPNGLVSQTTYDETGAPVHLRYDKVTGCSTNCTWLEFDVEESIHGQWLKQTSNLSTQEYAYDKAGRLTLVKDTPQGGGCTTRSYTFDANSNRTSLVTRAPGSGGVCDTRSTGTTQNYSYDTGDRLIGTGITYDDWGRITSLPSAYSGGGTLTTDYYSNDLVYRQSQDGITNTYALDAALRQRQRVQSGSQTGTETYHYAGSSDSPVWIDRGSSWSRNIAGFGALAIQDSANGITFQLANLHGDIVATADSDPNATRLLSIFEFDEYGNPKNRTSGKYGWLGSKQRRTELSSGVIQMGVRSYVPAMGRFLSPDPIEGGSANDYEYAEGDPINNFDLTGTKCVGSKSWISRCKAYRAQRQRELRTARRLARKTPNRASLIISCRKCGSASSSSLGDTFHSVVDKVSGAVDGAKTRFFRVGGSVYAKITAPSDAFKAAGDAFKLAQSWNPNRLIQAWQCGWYASGGSGTIGDCDPYEIVFGPPDKAR